MLGCWEVCKGANKEEYISSTQEQHKSLCSILQGASVTLHTILLEVGGTIYKNHTLEPFKKLGLHSQRVKKLASKLHVHCQLCCQTCPYQTCPFQQYYQLIRRRLQVKPATLLIPPLIFSVVEEIYGTATKVAPFPWLMRGVVFHCLRSIVFLWSWQNKSVHLVSDMLSSPRHSSQTRELPSSPAAATTFRLCARKWNLLTL